MGCDLEVSLICKSNKKADETYEKILSIAYAYEQHFSRFLKKSELSLLNKKKSLIVSTTFFYTFLVSKKLHNLTKKIFNPLVQIEKSGYNATFENIKNTIRTKKTGSYSTSYEKIHVNKETKRITLAPTQKLDFGGFLKGHVAQKMAEKAKEDPAIHGVIINIGGDICSRGTDEYNQTFLFSVYNPVTKKEIHNIALKNQSLSTSGTYKRIWETQNKKMHHILQSQDKENPDSDLVSASIIAKDGSVSDAFATTAIILGTQKAQKFLEKHPVQYILIKDNGTILTNQKTY